MLHRVLVWADSHINSACLYVRMLRSGPAPALRLLPCSRACGRKTLGSYCRRKLEFLGGIMEEFCIYFFSVPVLLSFITVKLCSRNSSFQWNCCSQLKKSWLTREGKVNLGFNFGERLGEHLKTMLIFLFCLFYLLFFAIFPFFWSLYLCCCRLSLFGYLYVHKRKKRENSHCKSEM